MVEGLSTHRHKQMAESLLPDAPPRHGLRIYERDGDLAGVLAGHARIAAPGVLPLDALRQLRKGLLQLAPERSSYGATAETGVKIRQDPHDESPVQVKRRWIGQRLGARYSSVARPDATRRHADRRDP